MADKKRVQHQTPDFQQASLRRLGITGIVVLKLSFVGLSLITYHLLERHSSDRSLYLTEYLLLFMVAVLAVVALVTALPPVIALFSRTRLFGTVHADPDGTRAFGDRTLIDDSDVDVTTRRQVLRLVRSAERLNDAEKELIRRISRFDADPATDRLIADVQMYTNRMIRQLEDIAVLNLKIDEKGDLPSSPDGRGKVPGKRRSDVELDNVTVL